MAKAERHRVKDAPQEKGVPAMRKPGVEKPEGNQGDPSVGTYPCEGIQSERSRAHHPGKRRRCPCKGCRRPEPDGDAGAGAEKEYPDTQPEGRSEERREGKGCRSRWS